MRKNAKKIDEENPELTAAAFRRARPVEEIPELAGVWPMRRPGQRGPQRAPTKQQVSLRLDRDVLAHFQQAGPSWQTRVNAALRRTMRRKTA